MKKWGRRLFSVAFSFMFLFISIGYAQLADTLTVTGTVSLLYKGVVITEVEEVTSETKNLTSVGYSYIIPTNLENQVTLSGNNQTKTVKYKITVYNRSPKYTYAYKGIVCDANLGSGYNNDLYSGTAGDSVLSIATTNESGQSFKVGTSIAPGEKLVFYATYTFGGRMTTGSEMKFLVNFKFGIHVASLGEAAVEKTLSTFINGLNNEVQYSNLVTNIDNKYETYNGSKYPERWRANYIGNVDNVTTQGKADTQVVENMLGEGLTLTIDNMTKNVTVLIKRENIDNNERTGDAYRSTVRWGYQNVTVEEMGCEMAIYMTPNNLDKNADEGEYQDDEDWAEVYISISTCTNDGTRNNDGTTNITSSWYQIGDLYEGIANIVAYNGDDGTGSFVTDNWKSLEKTYKVTENYSYTIAAGQTIKTIMRATDVNAYNEFVRLRQLANNAVAYIDANSDYFDIAEFTQAVETLRTVTTTANNTSATTRTLRANLIPILKDLESAVYPFLDFIE